MDVNRAVNLLYKFWNRAYLISNIQVLCLIIQFGYKIWEGHQRIYGNPFCNDNIEKELAYSKLLLFL